VHASRNSPRAKKNLFTLKLFLSTNFDISNYFINFKVHSFATIQEFARFDTVTYFTIKGEDSQFSETDDFLLRMKKETEYADQLEQLALWLQNIGNHKEGALFDLFRPERNCLALPPKRRHLEDQIDLRLYCHWVSDRVIILYNGGIKTAPLAQDCPNVSRHFYNAQSWTRQLKDTAI
jgi:hypothetical protein